MIDSCTSALQVTHGLPGDDLLPDIATLFLESHTTDIEDFFGDLSVLFSKVDSSTVIAHSLHDQSFQVGVIVDSHEQHR